MKLYEKARREMEIFDWIHYDVENKWRLIKAKLNEVEDKYYIINR